jgi:hypothetical protein
MITPASVVIGTALSGVLTQPHPAESISCLQNWTNAIQGAWEAQREQNESDSAPPASANSEPNDPPAARAAASPLPAPVPYDPERPIAFGGQMTQAQWDAYRRYYSKPGAKNLGGWGE